MVRLPSSPSCVRALSHKLLPGAVRDALAATPREWEGLCALARLKRGRPLGQARLADTAQTVATARSAGATMVLTVGGAGYGLAHLEEAARGGPAAAVGQGCARLTLEGCVRALVLAVDAPTIKPSDLSPLLAARRPGAA